MFMKVQLHIDEKFSEEKIIIEAPALSDSVQQLLTFAQHIGKNKTIRAKKEEEIYLLNSTEIQRVYTENRQVWAETATDTYLLGLPLYQVLELLPADFLQISQSEIINTKQIDHLKLTGSGLIQITLKNGQITYSSRRYLKAITELIDQQMRQQEIVFVRVGKQYVLNLHYISRIDTKKDQLSLWRKELSQKIVLDSISHKALQLLEEGLKQKQNEL